MDEHEKLPVIEPQAVAGTSGMSRKRRRSCSSSNSTSSSSSSSSSSHNKRSRRTRRKKKRARRSDDKVDKLIKEMGELRNIVANNMYTACHDNNSICSAISGELYDKELPDDETHNFSPDFTIDIETKLKEPSVPKTPANYLKMLQGVQRLSSTSWSEVM